MVKRVRFGTELVLIAGFGGVLALMGLAGWDSVRALHQIEAENTHITQNYLDRHHLLEQIRSSLYLSSTVLRDYLTDTRPEAAHASLMSLKRLHAQVDAALRQYGESIRSDQERSLFSDLKTEVARYWSIVTPVFRWHAGERRAQGLTFLQQEVLPRGAAMAAVADKINAVHEEALRAGNRRSAALFSRFRSRIMTILGLTLGIGTVLAGASIAHILRLEREAHARYEEVQRAQQELKQLSARLVEAQERERRSISRELHDEVGQALNALLVDLGNLDAVTPPANEEAHRLLGAAKELAEESVRALRNLALLLRPSMLDDLGLVPALHWQAREVSRRTGIRVNVEAEEVPDELPDEHKTCVYRVVQEALHNSSRHAGARNIRIAVRHQPERMLLTIQDDGKGFDAAQVRGLGLLGMEERVKHLGGAFQVLSRPGEGTMLRIELPLPESYVQQTGASA